MIAKKFRVYSEKEKIDKTFEDLEDAANYLFYTCDTGIDTDSIKQYFTQVNAKAGKIDTEQKYDYKDKYITIYISQVI